MIRNARNVEEVIARMRRGAREAIDAVGEQAVSDLKIMTGFQGPPRSTPFTPPHMDTTALNKSITSQPYEQDGGATQGRVIGENRPYSLALEFGNPERNLAPRPHQSVEVTKFQTDARITNVVIDKMRAAI